MEENGYTDTNILQFVVEMALQSNGEILFLRSGVGGLPWWLSGKEYPANAGYPGPVPSPGESHMLWNN